MFKASRFALGERQTNGAEAKRRRDVQRWIGQERGPYRLIRLEREKGRDPLLHAVGTRSRVIRACVQ